MLNITVHQRNANQSYETSPHTRIEELSSNRPQMTNAGQDVGGEGTPYTVDGNVNWGSHYEKQYGASSKNEKWDNYVIQQFYSWAYI